MSPALFHTALAVLMINHVFISFSSIEKIFHYLLQSHPQRSCPFWSVSRITTSIWPDLISWTCVEHFVSYFSPTRFDRKSLNCWPPGSLHVFRKSGPARGQNSWCWLNGSLCLGTRMIFACIMCMSIIIQNELVQDCARSFVSNGVQMSI